ncbi:MAG: translation elongation factor Ts [candidate division Zixibacteria bacterium]|nr:translation elongation factor Ts [candidate division Zixibacteria bacterium]MBU1470771.1 translation elongation factor Ts [candidate division Zixibacteria bacterium]MBU2625294.1 translation elongation factor Ts [candidate division Zixibacteria bacterium]
MQITASLVKELREKTGAGMMDCKKALAETDGDLQKATSLLREKGIAKAASKSSRQAKEGAIISYIHPGDKLGVLLELNCETDFVARTDDFKELSKNIAMQIAASSPLVIAREELDEETLEEERKIYRTQALNEGKPEQIVDKIVTGRLEKYYQEVCLLDQPYIRDQDKSVSDLLTEAVGKLGENLVIRRFKRFALGE